MRQVHPKQLRAELKDFLDLSTKEPIRIQRRAGDSFVLMSEKKYSEMSEEIMSLQRRLLGMAEVVAGKIEEYELGSKSRLDRFNKKLTKK
jgi:PHD/YefM family antitoxin component YafN of YafNO toxin-antitoxin module